MFVVGWFVGASGKSAVVGISVESAGLAGKGMCKVDGGTAVLGAGKGVGFRGTDGRTVGDWPWQRRHLTDGQGVRRRGTARSQHVLVDVHRRRWGVPGSRGRGGMTFRDGLRIGLALKGLCPSDLSVIHPD